VPGASAQRQLQVLGMDFAATLMLTLAMTWACLGNTTATEVTGS
jgi:hypothetical protein